MKLLQLNDAFNKRYCIFYTLKLLMVYIACNYQALKNQISQIMKLEKSIFRQSKSLTSSQADGSPLKKWCNRFTFVFASYRINNGIKFYWDYDINSFWYSFYISFIWKSFILYAYKNIFIWKAINLILLKLSKHEFINSLTNSKAYRLSLHKLLYTCTDNKHETWLISITLAHMYENTIINLNKLFRQFK